jgi:hemerythrin
MGPIRLSSEFRFGWPDLDREHQDLFDLVNRLNAAIMVGLPSSELALGLATLAEAAKTHFQSEEILMLASGSAQYQPHKLDHDRMLVEIQRVRDRVASGHTLPSELLALFVQSWLTHHISKFDLEMVAFQRTQPPSEGEFTRGGADVPRASDEVAGREAREHRVHPRQQGARH